jgi:2-methylisocitrate lyase-like PEP mutase family enzyme
MSFRDVLKRESIIIAPGSYDVISAQIIEKAGFPVCYVTGLGHEASDLGCPDLGLTTSVEIIRKVANIVQVVDVPVLCDADTGFGGVTNLVRTVKMFEAAGAGGIHIEDQTFPKRCGVLAGKKVIPAEAFVNKIRAAITARNSEEFVIIARTDAKALGIDEVIRRLNLYVDQGADMAMLGDYYTFEEYRRIAQEVKVPVVACAADEDHFSIQPNFSVDDWKKTGIKMVLYWHLSLFTAMKAVEKAVTVLKTTGSTETLENAISRYGEYEKVVKLSKWLEIDEKYGD